MDEKQILEVESSNHDRIYLYAGEHFWYAYERSAFHLVKVFGTTHTPCRHREEMPPRAICFCFAASAISEMIRSFTVLEEHGGRTVLMANESFTEEEFAQWKSTLLSMMKPKITEHSECT